MLTMMTLTMTVMNEPVHEVGEVPSRHGASVPVTHMAANVIHQITKTTTTEIFPSSTHETSWWEGCLQCKLKW